MIQERGLLIAMDFSIKRTPRFQVVTLEDAVQGRIARYQSLKAGRRKHLGAGAGDTHPSRVNVRGRQ